MPDAAAAGSSVDELAASTWLLPAGACQIPDALRYGRAPDPDPAHGAAAGAGLLPRGAPARLPGPDQAHCAERARAGAGAGRSGDVSMRNGHQRAAGAEQRGEPQTGPRRAIRPQGGLTPPAACGGVSKALGQQQAASMQGRGAAGAAARVQRGPGRVPEKGPRQGLGRTGDMCPGHAPCREIDQRAGARRRAGLKQGAASRGWAQ